MDDRQKTREEIEAKASVQRVKAWKQHRIGRKPPFRDYRAYYHAMRWGPFSYWTWRGMIILICGALILYVALFTACLSGGNGCNLFMTWNPWIWFLRLVP
jgi:hypothetical protein